MEEDQLKTARNLGHSIRKMIITSACILGFCFFVYFIIIIAFLNPMMRELNEIPEFGAPESNLKEQFDVLFLLTQIFVLSISIFIAIPSIPFIFSIKAMKKNIITPHLWRYIIFELGYLIFVIIDVSRTIVNIYFENSNIIVTLAFMLILLLAKVGATIFLFLTIKEGLFGNFTDDKKRKIKNYFIIMIIGSIYAISLELVLLCIVYLIGGLLVGSVLIKNQEPIMPQQQFSQST